MKTSQRHAIEIGNKLNINWTTIPVNTWHYAMNVELEHGNRYGSKTNVTGNNLLTTGKIVIAHLHEMPDYYQRLKKMEHSGEKYWKNHKRPDIFNS